MDCMLAWHQGLPPAPSPDSLCAPDGGGQQSGPQHNSKLFSMFLTLDLGQLNALHQQWCVCMYGIFHHGQVCFALTQAESRNNIMFYASPTKSKQDSTWADTNGRPQVRHRSPDQTQSWLKLTDVQSSLQVR